MQFQTLTAIVKLFLKRPDEAQGIVQQVLEKATKECDSADIRDRAYIYWRLLSSSDPNVGREVILADRPPISIPLSNLSAALLDELLADLSSLASAYHRPESTFVGKGRIGAEELARKAAETDVTREKALATVVQGANAENLLDFGADDEEAASASGSASAAQSQGLGGLADLMGDDGFGMSSASTPSAAANGLAGLSLGGSSSSGLGGSSLKGSAHNGGSSTQPSVAAVAAAQSTQLNDLLGLFDAAPGSNAPGAQTGLEALNALPLTPSGIPGATPASATSSKTRNDDDLLGLF